MAEIAPLRGIRFDHSRTGPIGPLIAPPYDVAGVRGSADEFSISAIENIDLGQPGNQHQLAAERYRAWLAQGALRRERAPAIYLHLHRFAVESKQTTRVGLIARIRLCDWDQGVIIPHERTSLGPRQERFERLSAVGANLSPLYFLYRDSQRDIHDLIAEWRVESHSHEAYDRMGGSHRLLPVFNTQFHRRLAEQLASRSLFVADGHHRYEAALAFRDKQRLLRRRSEGPWEYVLALLAAVEDPGVIVRPTHRIVTGGPMPTSSLFEILSRWFSVFEERSEAECIGDPVLFRVVITGSARAWIVRELPGAPHRALLPQDRGAAWMSLGVSTVEGILQSLFGPDLNATGMRVMPIVDQDAAIAEVREGRAQAAFLLPTPNLDRLLAVGDEGDLLPPKSTWFEPKAPAGLVINDLEMSATE